MGHGGVGPELLANETLMKEGQVIRSTTNQVYIHYRSLRQTNHGMFSLHYQGKLTLQATENNEKYLLGIATEKGSVIRLQ